jgi:uncharacterized protein (TIGR02594 family)
MIFPTQYKWLFQEGGPKMLVEALRLYGIEEYRGAGDNPQILSWAKDVGVSSVYKHDETSWCGLFMAVVAKRAGKEVVKDPLWALNWANFGVKATTPMLGDILTFKRFDANGKLIGGHVTLYIGEDDNYYHCLGGNQSDCVNITRIAKSRLFQARRPIYNQQPANVRVVKLNPIGFVSNNEA